MARIGYGDEMNCGISDAALFWLRTICEAGYPRRNIPQKRKPSANVPLPVPSRQESQMGGAGGVYPTLALCLQGSLIRSIGCAFGQAP